jgi:hypothetical protein
VKEDFGNILPSHLPCSYMYTQEQCCVLMSFEGDIMSTFTVVVLVLHIVVSTSVTCHDVVPM